MELKFNFSITLHNKAQALVDANVEGRLHTEIRSHDGNP